MVWSIFKAPKSCLDIFCLLIVELVDADRLHVLLGNFGFFSFFAWPADKFFSSRNLYESIIFFEGLQPFHFLLDLFFLLLILNSHLDSLGLHMLLSNFLLLFD